VLFQLCRKCSICPFNQVSLAVLATLQFLFTPQKALGAHGLSLHFPQGITDSRCSLNVTWADGIGSTSLDHWAVCAENSLTVGVDSPIKVFT
jgi:hypothetical protein